MTRLAFIGGIYSNYWALVATLEDIRRRGVDGIWFLGDLGAFGPHPDRVPELLIEQGIPGIQGNYEESLSSRADDCHCGYTDPRDNHYAQISYDYTFANTSEAIKDWMGTLPRNIRLEVEGRKLLLVHGSPRRINEFLWRSTSPEPFLERLCRDADADVIVCTHTGLHWQRALPSGRRVINAGVIGRPANDGRTNVWYALVDVRASSRLSAFGSRDAGAENRGAGPTAESREPGAVDVEFVPVSYAHDRLAAEMRAEKLPEEFVETILTGWWTTCLEALPARERAAGRY